MSNHKTDLIDLALRASKPFCSTHYKVCESGVCPQCGSDDLMRHVEGVGVEFGADWIIEHYASQCEAVDLEDHTEQLLNEAYEDEVKVCGMSFGPQGSLLKTLDPVAFRCAVADEHSALIESGDYFERKNGDLIALSDLVEALEAADCGGSDE